MDDLDLDNPAWRFALRLYREDGVAAECLRLQDEAGIDVSLLLVCLWLGAERGVCLTASDVEGAESAIDGWRRDVVQALRSIRGRLKAAPEMARPAVAAYRKRVAALEIEAEQIQIALLFEWAERFAAARTEFGQRAAGANLGAVLAAAGSLPPDTPRLRAALGLGNDDRGPELACRNA